MALQSQQASPVASRPRITGYGVPEDEGGLLPWSHAEERLRSAKNYWVATVSPDGAPHAMPVWGTWHEGALYFGTGQTTRTARNLAANPRAAIHLENGDNVVVLEGEVEVLRNPDPALSTLLDDTSAEKYGWRPSSELTEPVGEGYFIFRPRLAFAWTSFPQDATRWVIDAGR